VLVGPNWKFGHRARGDARLLERLAPALDFTAVIVAAVTDEHGPISSSRIRQLVSQGRIAEAAGLLGRPFSILGTVEHGRQIGRALGYPTANLDPHNEVKPPPGIYAVRVRHGDHWYDGAAYLARPGHGADVEVHVLAGFLDLYGQDLEVFFHAFVREDRQFDEPAALQEQIRKDVEEIRRILAARAPVVSSGRS
jgi:riboflavin kinase/FMN adenylyltransferase